MQRENWEFETHTIITLQKQVAEILGIPLKPLDTDEPD